MRGLVNKFIVLDAYFRATDLRNRFLAALFELDPNLRSKIALLFNQIMFFRVCF